MFHNNNKCAFFTSRSRYEDTHISQLMPKEKVKRSSNVEAESKKNYIFPRVWVNERYNRHQLPPTENNEPLLVNVSIYLSSVLKIDDPTQVGIILPAI